MALGLLGQPLASASNPLALQQQQSASIFQPPQAAPAQIDSGLLNQGLASAVPQGSAPVTVDALAQGDHPPAGTGFADMVGHYLGQIQKLHGPSDAPAPPAPTAPTGNVDSRFAIGQGILG